MWATLRAFTAMAIFFYGPVIDGTILQDLPSIEFSRGHFTKVPLLVDHDAYEGVIFSNESTATQAEVLSDLEVLWPDAKTTFFDRLFQLYPSAGFNSSFYQRQTIFGDAFVACPSYIMATSVANYGLPVWKLKFAAGSEVHGATIPFVYSTSINPSGNNATIGAIMRDYFVSFFVHQDPNKQSFSDVAKPYWDPYNAGGTFNVLQVNYTMIGVDPDADASPQCDFMQGHPLSISS